MSYYPEWLDSPEAFEQPTWGDDALSDLLAEIEALDDLEATLNEINETIGVTE